MKLNLKGLNKAIETALTKTAIEVAASATIAIEAERWDWDNPTVRSDGSIATSPRNIVDTGKLRDSQTVTINDHEATISYTADHAAIVHSDRPWLKTALNETAVAKVFADELRKAL